MEGGVKKQIQMGLRFLEKSCRPITGFQDDGLGTSRDTLKPSFFPEDVFTSLNALDLLGDSLSVPCRSILREFVAPESGTGTLNLNKYQHLIPDDVEDTALYHYIFLRDGLLPNDKRILDVARLIYLNKAQNGIIQRYFTPCEEEQKERLEAGCLSNAMRFLYYVGASEEALKTEEYLLDWLLSEKYLEGTHRYPSPDTFLYYCSAAVVHNRRAKEKFEEPLAKALEKRILESITGNEFPLDFSLRILALDYLNKLASAEFKESVNTMVNALRGMQDESTGAFRADSLFKQEEPSAFLGGPVVSTIFAVSALKAYEKNCLASP